MAKHECITYATPRPGLAEIRFNRPHRLNAVIEQLFRETLDALAAAEDDRNIRVVILTGEGRAFCVGADLKEHAKGARTGRQKRDYQLELDRRRGCELLQCQTLYRRLRAHNHHRHARKQQLFRAVERYQLFLRGGVGQCLRGDAVIIASRRTDLGGGIAEAPASSSTKPNTSFKPKAWTITRFRRDDGTQAAAPTRSGQERRCRPGGHRSSPPAARSDSPR